MGLEESRREARHERIRQGKCGRMHEAEKLYNV